MRRRREGCAVRPLHRAPLVHLLPCTAGPSSRTFRASAERLLTPLWSPSLQDYQHSWAKFMHMMRHNAQRFRSNASWRRGMGFE